MYPDGKLIFLLPDLAKWDDLWYVKDGQVQFGYTGVARGTDQYGNTSTYYVTNGRVDKSFRGLACGIYNGEEGWINFCDGKPKYSYESLVEYNGAWWKMSGYMIDFDYTGAASNESGTWYVRNGQVDFGYTGVIEGKEEADRTSIILSMERQTKI